MGTPGKGNACGQSGSARPRAAHPPPALRCAFPGLHLPPWPPSLTTHNQAVTTTHTQAVTKSCLFLLHPSPSPSRTLPRSSSCLTSSTFSLQFRFDPIPLPQLISSRLLSPFSPTWTPHIPPSLCNAQGPDWWNYFWQLCQCTRCLFIVLPSPCLRYPGAPSPSSLVILQDETLVSPPPPCSPSSPLPCPHCTCSYHVGL